MAHQITSEGGTNLAPSAPFQLGAEGGASLSPAVHGSITAEGGTDESPAAPEQLSGTGGTSATGGDGLLISGVLTPDIAGELPLAGDSEGFPIWSDDGELGSIESPPRYVVRKSSSMWRVESQSPNVLLWSYYDFAGAHPTPFTVPEWNPEAGVGTLTVTQAGAAAPEQLTGAGGADLEPSAPAQLTPESIY